MNVFDFILDFASNITVLGTAIFMLLSLSSFTAEKVNSFLKTV